MTAIALGQRSQFRLGIADEKDDAELRALLRRTPIEGSITVAFEREPSFFHAASIQGEFHQVGVARETATQRIIGMGTRSVGQGFLHGDSSPLGYLSDLRLEPQYRGGTLVARGYRMFRDWHQDGRTQFYYTVIFEDNHSAMKTIAQGRAGLPSYHDLGLIHCPGINVLRRMPPVSFGEEIIRGSAELLPEIVDCLNRYNRSRQFAPLHRVEDFSPGGRWLGFDPGNFYVARIGGRIVGVLGKWDQREFKQTRVVGYRGPFRWFRPLANAISPLTRSPRLPGAGTVLPYFYAAFAAVEDENIEVFRALLRQMYNDTAGTEFLYIMISLHERDPLLGALKDYSLTPFAGRLFAVYYQRDERSCRFLKDGVPHVEASLL
jgi:hypothetical protein